MKNPTLPVFKLILAVGFGGLLLILLGIFDHRDLLVISGALMICCSITTIARLVK